MKTFLKLYSDKAGEIKNFLQHLYSNSNVKLQDDLFWKKEFENPLEMVDIISVLIDNQENFKINIWICLDKDILINVNKNNADEIIRYLFERYPF